MMEFLLAGPPPALSIAYGLCCISDGSGRWVPEEFAARIDWSGRFFGLWPKFLTEQLDAGRGDQEARA
jgi:hypothetical protein